MTNEITDSNRLNDIDTIINLRQEQRIGWFAGRVANDTEWDVLAAVDLGGGVELALIAAWPADSDAELGVVEFISGGVANCSAVADSQGLNAFLGTKMVQAAIAHGDGDLLNDLINYYYFGRHQNERV